MKIQRVKHITFFPQKDMFEEVDVKLHGDFTESVTDFSHFVPTSEAVRALPVGDISLQHYQFPDGKDDGSPVPVALQRGRDIAEISEEVATSQVKVKERWETFKAENALDVSNPSPNSEK